MARGVATRDPGGLATLVEATGSLLMGSLSESSKKFYVNAFHKFKHFVLSNLMGVNPFPAGSSAVALFITHMYQSGYAAATIASHLSAISFFHKLFGYHDPADQFIIRKLVASVHKSNPTVDSRFPVSLDILHKCLDSATHICSSAYEALLFRCMCSLMFHAFMRIGEATLSHNTVMFQHVSITSQSLSITFHKFKHHSGPPIIISVPANGSMYCPVFLALQYIAKRGTESGPFFAFPGAIPVQSSAFCKLLERSLSWAGLSHLPIKSHSFRIGAATWAAAQGYSEQQIQAMGRWKSMAFKRYIRIQSFEIKS